MTQTFTQDVVITNTTSNIGLKINQTGSNEGLQINQATNNYGLRITKTHTGTSNPLFISNAGGGYGIYEYQSAEGNGFVVNKVSTGASSCFTLINAGTGHGGYISQSGEGNAMVINKTSTGGAGGVVVLNAGIGSGFVIQQSGAGKALYINKTNTSDTVTAIDVVSSGTGTDLKITHANTAGDCINIISSNSGYSQISGRPTAVDDATWGVDCQGDAGFNSVTSVSQVYAPNATVAGGRVFIYVEREGEEPTVTYKTFCDWGLVFEDSISYRVLNPWNYEALVGVTLALPVQCPVINITPWMGGQYDVDDDTGLFGNGPTALPGAGSMSLDANLIAISPQGGILCEGGASTFWFEVTYNTVSTPALHGEYVVGPDPDAEGQYLDLVFDFTVTGAYCPILE